MLDACKKKNQNKTTVLNMGKLWTNDEKEDINRGRQCRFGQPGAVACVRYQL